AVYVLQRDAKPGERLAMWGWQPNLYVETGMAQGTRDAHTAFLIATGSLRDYYRARYLADFRHNQPGWFVDAVGPGRFCYQDRTLSGYETFPALAAIVQSDYTFVADVEGYRIYRRK
ncbi:MAG TPA: hypothetical protein VFJ90_08375, partial [Candidatus Didemnitutus sp.]|nr:hypothetical protein [Candidatus Didemnitutus sp.]